ncbi:O-antigen ligase family protein [Arthrospiribacter ruber]|uniref:O-antigen ligase domain-containing protein n=1 Tax=Arthrospiribacter ruber TaxID=2487934 RepID=A0A951MD66_9BACT|nr:O-antigen ligase family protein [Arthrospiribacter ruber]MBW3467530.1 O-antigen ligase domain-containing protein [Arthrospiribacter ruber]
MSLIFFFLIAILTTVLLFWVLNQVLMHSKWEYGVYFLLFFLPFYITTLSVVYLATNSPLIVNIFQFLKEIVVLGALAGFLLFNRNIFDYPFRLHKVDYLYIGFIGLAFIYLVLPLGAASTVNKALYFKNMLIPALVYFMGRNTVFDDKEIRLIFRGIFAIAVGAFLVNLFEKAIDTHLQSLTGYALFNLAINDIEPTGHFDLTWTFETQAVTKRLASFFSDPLELASSVLLGFSAGLIWFLTSKRENWLIPTVVMLCSLGSLFFAASRAAFLAFFVMIFFVAIIFRLYKLILSGFGLALLFVVYVLFFASEEFYYFVVDTITFENTSSVGHLVEWLLALDSMIANPFGIGLAMSGNVGSVEDELRVGGENQFLIYGVQLGWIGMLLYMLLLAYAILTSLKVFNRTENTMTARIAFVAASVRVGLLLPLFTANAEVYTYVSWMTWWMLGYSINAYQAIKYKKPALA